MRLAIEVQDREAIVLSKARSAPRLVDGARFSFEKSHESPVISPANP
jgi:hypothetical protein